MAKQSWIDRARAEPAAAAALAIFVISAATLAGAWYFVAGFAVLILASQSHGLSPWTMGLPFAVGQSLMAAILYVASGETDADR